MSIWIMIIVEVLKNLPALIKVFKEIFGMIKTLPKAQQHTELMNLKSATAAAKGEDYRPLDELRKRLRRECKK